MCRVHGARCASWQNQYSSLCKLVIKYNGPWQFFLFTHVFFHSTYRRHCPGRRTMRRGWAVWVEKGGFSLEAARGGSSTRLRRVDGCSLTTRSVARIAGGGQTLAPPPLIELFTRQLIFDGVGRTIRRAGWPSKTKSLLRRVINKAQKISSRCQASAQFKKTRVTLLHFLCISISIIVVIIILLLLLFAIMWWWIKIIKAW